MDRLRRLTAHFSVFTPGNGAKVTFDAAPELPARASTSAYRDPRVNVHRRNETEKVRLQGLMRSDSIIQVDGQARETTVSRQQQLNLWMVNEGPRRLFVAVWVFLHALVFTLGFLNYQLHDNLTNARATFGITYPIARSAALVLHYDVAFILLPVCRTFVSAVRRGPFNAVIPFEKNITFHMLTAWSIVVFTVIHVGAHVINAVWLAIPASESGGGRLVAWLEVVFASGPGLTGVIMTIALVAMVWTAMEKRRRAHFNRFYLTHHLFLVFFVGWQLHGMFCMIQPDRPPFCSYKQIGSFWKFWLVGGVVYIYERIMREVRSRHRTFISKVILHPSKVVEVQIKKEKTETRAGQYIMINCPEVSYWQWHPFTLTSSPYEDFISVHIRVVGDFTTAFAKALGCDVENKASEPTEVIPLKKVLPRVMVDGPFGSASEDVFKFEVAVLVGGGIGCTPFASILKTIWYRMSNQRQEPTRLSKVYFFWICRDTQSFEWFQALLHAIEEEDVTRSIEIHTYYTAKVKDDEMNNIFVHDVGGDRDVLTKLRSPTHYGRPNWDRVFQSIGDKHADTDCGVFFCGPKVLGSTLHKACNKWTTPSCRFHWGKENF